MRRFVLGIVVAVLVPQALPAAGWKALLEADAAGHLVEARAQALEIVRDRPDSPEAAAAAGWWLDHYRVLPEPEAILEAAPLRRPPELEFLLGSLDGFLHHGPPPGTLAAAELAGPFGSFDRLDLERGTWPPDAAMPPPETLWSPENRPFRLRLRSADGWIGPAAPMLRTGVYLALWTLRAPAALDGWLVVELDANADVELDGERIARARPLDTLGPQVLWFETRLEPGLHRLRIAMASPKVPSVRVRWFPREGGRLGVEPPVPGDPGELARSHVRAGVPPVEASLGATETGTNVVERELLAATLASWRQAPLEERRHLERAAKAAPGEPLVHLELARFFLTRPTGADATVDFRRCREQLGGAGESPGALLLERRLDLRQQRQEDADALLDRLLREAPEDPRVMVSALQRAIRNHWTREIGQGLDRLSALLQGSPSLVDLQLDGLRALDRLGEYRHRLEALAAVEPLHDGLLDRLADTVLLEPSLAVVEARRAAGDEPELDLERIHLLLELGRRAEARSALAEARNRWGDLYALDQLAIQEATEGTDRTAARAALDAALAHAPASVDLRTLLWRWGGKPFFEPWRTDGMKLLREARKKPVENTDSVLVLDQAVERVFPDGSSLHYYHGITLAFTPQGARQAAALNLLPGAELLRVRIHKEDGRVIVPADLAPEPGTVLADVKAGDAVEQEYVAAIDRTGGAIRGHMSPYIYRFADSDRAFGRSEYILLHPPDLRLEIEGNLEGVEQKETRAGDLVATAFRVDQVPAIPPEPFSPPMQELLPWVTYGFGVTWATVGDIVRDRVLGILQGSPELTDWSKPLLSGPATLEARLKRLVAALVDTVDRGGALLDPGSTAGAAFSVKRGNRLGILLSVLRDANLDVDLVLTRPLAYARTHLKVPGMDLFGVPLLRVRDGAETVWIDLGEETAGVGHIRPQFQGSDGLLLPMKDLSLASVYLETLPRFPNPELAERIQIQGRVNAGGDADLAVELNLRGERARQMVDAVRSLPADRVEMLYQQIASGLFTGASQVHGAILDPDGSPRLSLSLHLDGACEKQPDGTLVCRQLNLIRPLSDALASLPERRFPLVLQLPVIRIHELELTLPEGMTAEAAPRKLEAEWGSLSEERTVSGGTLHSVLELKIPAQKISPERYPDFARFCHAVDALMTRPVRIVPR